MDVTKPRNPWYVAILALASSAILIVGWLVRPREIPDSPAPVPSETELQQLARRAERLSLESMTTYFAGIARQAEVSLVHVPSEGLSGLVWDAQRIVTAPLVSHNPSSSVGLTTAGGRSEAELLRWGPHLPLSVVAAPPGAPALTPAPRAESAPAAGEWIVAVWRTATGRTFAVGNYLQPAALTCDGTSAQEVVTSISLTSMMTGGGLFDIEGNLRGAILPCNGNIAAIAISTIETILGRDDSIQQLLVARLGLGVGVISAAEQQYFKATAGLVVREVWRGQPGEAAGLRPGDIITALNGQSVDEVEDLRPLTDTAGAPVELSVQRGAKRLPIALPNRAPGASTIQDPSGGRLLFELPSREFTIQSVQPDSRAARAGIQPGDEIVGINRAEPRTRRQVDALFAGDRPLWVEIERGRRRIGVLVE